MAPLFELRNLSAGYDTPLLQSVSFTAEAGSLIGILGRNGCGKTTLLRGIAGTIRRFSGEILIDQKNCTAMSARQQAAYLSVLPQQTEIMAGLLARDLIEMGCYPYGSLFRNHSADSRLKIKESAELLGISPLLDQDCSKLSQGQRQLVLLARLLVQDTPVMLLDEPNTALDYDNTHFLFSAIRSLVKEKQKIALTVLHDPELALQYCDRLLILKDRTICADLSPDVADQETLEAALRQLYPHVHLRKDPYCGRFRCYNQSVLSESNYDK